MRRPVFFALMSLVLAGTALGQSSGIRIRVSDSADFLHEVRRFEPGMTIHFDAAARRIDASAVAAARFVFTPHDDGTPVDGTLTATDRGTFEASVAADHLVGGSPHWTLTVELTDGVVTVTGRTHLAVLASGHGPEDPHGGDRPEMVELEGVIEAIDAEAHSITVAGTTVHVAAETVIHGERDGRLRFGDLAVGMSTRVVAEVLADGSLVAHRIHVKVRFERDDVHAAGPIESIDPVAFSIQVAGHAFAVTADTEIEGMDGSVLSLADLSVGQVVRVEGFRTDSGLVATEIRALVRLHADSGISGPLTSVGDHAIVVAGATFVITPATRVQRNLDWIALEPGARIDVRYTVATDASLQALRLHARRGHDEGVRLFGTLTGMGADRFVVSGIDVGFDAGTRWVDASGAEVPAGSIPDGSTVRVRATYDAALGITALLVVETHPVEFGAEVAGRTATAIRLEGLEVRVTDDTEFVGPDGYPADESSVGMGAFVEIVAVTEVAGKSGSGALQAEQVMVQSMAASTAIDPSTTPDGFALTQNYPNPFNPETTIAFTLDRPSTVRLDVFTLLGQRVRTLVHGTLPAGPMRVRWDARDADGRAVASGVFLYRLSVGGRTATRMMTLLR